MKRYSYVFVILIAMFSCKRDVFEPFYGTQTCPNADFSITKPFTVATTTSSKKLPGVLDFTLTDAFHIKFIDSLRIDASFNAAATWRVEIRGQSSFAKKIYTGTSDVVKLVWYGRPTGSRFFMDEKIDIVFTVLCRDDLTQKVSLDLKASKFINPKPKIGNYAVNDPRVFVMENFDGITIAGLDKNSQWTSNWETDAAKDIEFGSGKLDTAFVSETNNTNFCTMGPSPQGGSFLSMVGTTPIPFGLQKNTYGNYFVYIPTELLKRLPADRSRVWLNFYASAGRHNATKLVIDYRQEYDPGCPAPLDPLTPIAPECKIRAVRVGKQGSFTLNPGNDWQMYSYNLNQLEILDTPFDANKALILVLTVVQSGGFSPTEFDIDFINFTIDEPFIGTEK